MKCMQCRGSHLKIAEKPDRWRYLMQCKECGLEFIKDDTPFGYYAEAHTKRGMVGKPYKGLNVRTLGRRRPRNDEQKRIIEHLS